MPMPHSIVDVYIYIPCLSPLLMFYLWFMRPHHFVSSPPLLCFHLLLVYIAHLLPAYHHTMSSTYMLLPYSLPTCFSSLSLYMSCLFESYSLAPVPSGPPLFPTLPHIGRQPSHHENVISLPCTYHIPLLYGILPQSHHFPYTELFCYALIMRVTYLRALYLRL